jgi:A/G-specific adenine glycosylase
VTKEEIYALARQLTPADFGADYASAIMDLGATVCTPENPKCTLCPWYKECIARKKNIADKIPLIRKPEKKERVGHLWLVRNKAGAFCIRKRGGKGLLSGLYEFPWVYADEELFYPITTPVAKVVHVFTHFKLTLNIYEINAEKSPIADGIFVMPKDFKNYPFSTLMKKVIQKI